MKNIVKYFLILSAVAVSFACQKEAETFAPGEEDLANCYGVYFPVQDALGNHTYDPEMEPVVDITVARTNTSGDITVPVKVSTSEDGIFDFGTLSFADGQSETTLHVDFSKAGIGTTYSFSATLDGEQYVSKYNSGAISADFSVLIVSWLDYLNPVTKEPAEITLNQGWWGETHMAKMRYYEVNDVRTCVIYSIEDGNGIWGDAVDATLQFTWYLKKTNSDGNQLLKVDKQYFGFDYDGWDSVPVGDATSPIYVYDWCSYWVERGEWDGTWDEFYSSYGDPDGSYPLSYYDGNGGFIFNLRYYIPGLGGFSPDPYEFKALADGFIRVDYSLKLESDYTVEGVTPVYVETGVDVKSLKYAVIAGELSGIQTENAAADILAGKIAATEFSDLVYDEDENVNYATLEIQAEETGTYTIVVLAFDEKKAHQNTASTSFKYIAAGDTAEYAVDIEVKTEATPDRYVQTGEYNEYNSFAFYVLGNDVTDAHILVTPYKKLTNAALDDLKYTTKNAVDAETIEAINGEGGFYTVVGGLDPGTEYIVLVWATNGSEDTYVYALWETTPNPEVWKPIGKGVYTDDFFTTFWNVQNLTWEVEMEQSEDDPTRFKMVYPYDDKFLYNEDGDWDTGKSYDIVITIPDSKHVWIAPQEIGVNWGYGMISIASTAGRYMGSYSIEVIEANDIPFGTCEDGVITFPEKGLVINLPDYSSSWYYANSNLAFKLVLPEGVSAGAPKPSAAPVQKPVQMKSNLVEAIPQLADPTFERELKPAQVKVTVSYERKAKEGKTYPEITR